MTTVANVLTSLLMMSVSLPFTQELSMGGSPLYSPDDKILLLNNSNFQANICGSDRAWLVEFYSSWCGHCIHFAPTFKELAADVYGWRDVMSIGAIDCAMEENMPTCREYEVMGYPSIKFFSPSTPAGDMGQERQNRDKSIPAIKRDMVNYLRDLQTNRKERAGKDWPILVPANVTGETISNLWEEGTVMALLLVEEGNSSLGSEVLLDVWTAVNRLKVPLVIRRIEINQESEKLLQKYHPAQGPGLVALSRNGSLLDNFSGLTNTRESWYSAIKDFIWRKSSELSITKQKIENMSQDKGSVEGVKTGLKEKSPQSGASKKELINRRFKVFTSDLEKALLYSISHEVAQHNSIAGQTLLALQDYVTVLEKYFPARIEIGLFLRQLRLWVHRHQDTIRGEDLSTWMSSYTTQHGIKAAKEWIGCKGSKPQYGGYPCGLWSLWHTLTVRQSSLGLGDPSEVLNSMQSYIEQFFGCRECARHFRQAIQDGEAIKEEVKTHDDAVLLLWRLHNKANLRLQGDISEDPVFPKIIFPPKEFCTDCYSFQRGTNLWDEFNRNAVLAFLKNQYDVGKLNSQGMSGDLTALGQAMVPVREEEEKLDTSNFKKEENSSRFVFFNGADISICFMLWTASAFLLIVIYIKFFSGKRLRRKSGIHLLPK